MNGQFPTDIRPIQGERPRLLPFNRRLRHLRGVSLRNLSLAPNNQRPRGRTIDDEALPSALKSPAKLLAVSENSKLSHTRSLTNLKAHGDTPTVEQLTEKSSSVQDTKSKINAPQTPRRKSTLEWANSTPGQRQQSLREAVNKHSADVFFSIHCEEVEGPIYVSEVLLQTNNPNFKTFDLSAWGAQITRQQNLQLKFWIRDSETDQWQCLLDLFLNLRSLQFLGTSLEYLYHSLLDNCVLFSLDDGFYTLADTTEKEVLHTPLPSRSALTTQTEPTSSYDALMRLATFDDCVQDATCTRQKLAHDLDTLLLTHTTALFAKDRIEEATDSLSRTKRAVSSEQRQIKIARNRLEDLRTNLAHRRQTIHSGRGNCDTASQNMKTKHLELGHLKGLLSDVNEKISGQRRRICTDVSDIYPVEPIPSQSFAFKIRGLPLSDSRFQKGTREDIVSAALGHVSHAVYILSFYLSIPLMYPIHPSSSGSYITDPISLMSGNRNFPLYLRGTVFYRFEYGVFLLNKNIELLANKLGLRVMDIRQTLPNLKYILYIATAGKGEMPMRKAGGVKGLLLARSVDTTPSNSRRGSNESYTNHDVSKNTRISTMDGFKNANGSASKLQPV